MPIWLRRILGVGALLAGLAAAFWQSRARSQSVDIAFVLSHVALSVDGVVLDRQRLTGLAWRIADQEPKTWNWQHLFAGQAPEATDPVTIRLPVDGAELEITCKFELLPGSVPLRTSTRVAAPAHADGVVPVDIEACGSLAR